MDFGTLIWVHRGRFSSGGWLGYLGLALLLLGLFGIAKASFTESPERGGQPLRLEVLALPFGALCLLRPIHRWRQSVAVYERGFIWTRLDKTVRVPRESVRRAKWTQRTGPLGPYDELEIELISGPLSIQGIDQPEQLCNLLNALAESPHQPETALGSWRAPGMKTGDRSQTH